IFIQPRVHDNGVAWLDARREGIVPIAADRSRVVGREKSIKGGLDSRTAVSDGVDMVHMTALRRLRLLSRADCYFMPAHTGNTIRIGQTETALVFGVGL